MKLTPMIRSKILYLYDENVLQKDIAKKVSVHPSTVSRTIKKYLETGSIEHLKRTRGPNILNSKDLSLIEKIPFNNPKLFLRKVEGKLKEKRRKTVSHMTIKRWHNKNNRFAYSTIKKPLLSKNNIISRHKLAED
ncbi:hypothetical protein NGRA_3272 [Nosema granulosis]|uniref:Uncharacterized protein n=1 Tax=Nosema granulosis TaxID=83296 RepID=A0A9P6GV18_9MICR|nr:hypothetical protein NGRA_3272 [Nosema granulosis]